MSLRDRINRQPVQQIPLRKIQIGERRRENRNVRTAIAGLKTSMEDIGLLHPIIIDENFLLATGCRRLAAAQKLGWTSIKTIQVALSQEELRTIELDENEQRQDLDAHEASMERLEEFKSFEQAHRENLERNQSVTEKALRAQQTQKKAASRAKQDSGIDRGTLSRDRKIVGIVKDYPFLKHWTQRTILDVFKALYELPSAEHAGAKRLIAGFNTDIDSTDSDSGKQKIMAYGARAAKNLERFSSMNRAWIYKLAANGKAKNSEEARQIALGIPPSSDPRIHYVTTALDELIECLQKNTQKDSTNATIRDCKNMLTTVVKQLEGTFDKMMREYMRKTPMEVRQ